MKKAGRPERAAFQDGPYEPLATNHELLTTIIITGGFSWQNY